MSEAQVDLEAEGAEVPVATCVTRKPGTPHVGSTTFGAQGAGAEVFLV